MQKACWIIPILTAPLTLAGMNLVDTGFAMVPMAMIVGIFALSMVLPKNPFSMLGRNSKHVVWLMVRLTVVAMPLTVYAAMTQ